LTYTQFASAMQLMAPDLQMMTFDGRCMVYGWSVW
jgi:hypothetical protein